VNKKKIEKTTAKVYNELQECLQSKEIKIFEPYYSFVKKKGFFLNKHILIKVPSNSKEKSLEEALVRLSAKNWNIDPDPENLF
jgi:primosomal protein N'